MTSYTRGTIKIRIFHHASRVVPFLAAILFLAELNFKMADSDVEIDIEDGVEVQTIMEGQASMPGPTEELDFMVQEEVETTTDGDTLTVELDPVDNVIIALQQNDHHLSAGGHFDVVAEEQNGDPSFGARELVKTATGRKRKAAPGTSSKSGKGSGPSGSSRKRSKKPKKGTVRFANRQIPAPLTGAGVAKELREANEISFDPEKRSRQWKKRKVPVKTLDGGSFSVSLWSTGECGGGAYVLPLACVYWGG